MAQVDKKLADLAKETRLALLGKYSEIDLQKVLNQYTKKDVDENLQFKLIDYDDLEGEDTFDWATYPSTTLVTMSVAIRYGFPTLGEKSLNTAEGRAAWRKFSMEADICQFFLYAAFGLDNAGLKNFETFNFFSYFVREKAFLFNALRSIVWGIKYNGIKEFVGAVQNALPQNVRTVLGQHGTTLYEPVLDFFETACTDFVNYLNGVPAPNPPGKSLSFLDVLRGAEINDIPSPFAQVYFDCPYQRTCQLEFGSSPDKENFVWERIKPTEISEPEVATDAMETESADDRREMSLLETFKVYEFYAYAENEVAGADPSRYIKYVDDRELVYFPETIRSTVDRTWGQTLDLFGPETKHLKPDSFFMEYAETCKSGEFLLHDTANQEEGMATMKQFLTRFWEFLKTAVVYCTAVKVSYTDWKLGNIGIANLKSPHNNEHLIQLLVKKTLGKPAQEGASVIDNVSETEVTEKIRAADRKVIAEYLPISEGSTIRHYGKLVAKSNNLCDTFRLELGQQRRTLSQSSAHMAAATPTPKPALAAKLYHYY